MVNTSVQSLKSIRSRGKGWSMSSDPNLNHEAVRLYRETFRLCPSYGRRQDIISTVTNIELWKTVVNEWKTQKWNPLRINWMLSEYERREKLSERTTAIAQRSTERRSDQKHLSVRVSKRRHPEMPSMPTAKGIDLRASRGTLERIVASALQEMQQPDRSNK